MELIMIPVAYLVRSLQNELNVHKEIDVMHSISISEPTFPIFQRFKHIF